MKGMAIKEKCTIGSKLRKSFIVYLNKAFLEQVKIHKPD
jgi:hypothetical protein